jgi:predicted N-formylglutamate amidohydrolase
MAQVNAGHEWGGSLVEERTVPYRIENAEGRGAAVILVDHASNHIPERWGTLGLEPRDRVAHIAWDPGALPVARELSRRLDAPLVAGTVSRLVLDLNRPVGSTTMMPETSETTPIPGNRGLTEMERRFRVDTIWEPYHRAVSEVVDRQIAQHGDQVAIVAVHTFTPVYKGVSRALRVGVLFDRDDRLGRQVLDRLAGEDDLVCRANEPYAPADEVYYTLSRHADARGLASVMIEIRNDLLTTQAGRLEWAERLAAALAPAAPDGGQHRQVQGGRPPSCQAT